MKLSDTSAGLIAFLRPLGGSDQFLETYQPGFHHASFEVDDVDVDMVGLGGCSAVTLWSGGRRAFDPERLSTDGPW